MKRPKSATAWMGDTKFAKKEQAVVRVVTNMLLPATCRDVCFRELELSMRSKPLGIAEILDLAIATSHIYSTDMVDKRALAKRSLINRTKNSDLERPHHTPS